MAPGVWRAQVGRPESLTLLGAAGAKPSVEALRRMPDAAFPLDRGEIEARQWDWKTALRFPLALDEEVYGLGVDFRTMRRTGSVFLLHVDHWGGVDGPHARARAALRLDAAATPSSSTPRAI